MNRILTITQVKKYFVVELNGNSTPMINEAALTYFLKNQVKLSKGVIAACLRTFKTAAKVEINLDKVG